MPYTALDTPHDFESHITRARPDLLVLTLFTSSHADLKRCTKNKLDTSFDKIADTHPEIACYRVSTDECPDLARAQGVSSSEEAVFVLYRSGKEVRRFGGVDDEGVLEGLREVKGVVEGSEVETSVVGHRVGEVL